MCKAMQIMGESQGLQALVQSSRAIVGVQLSVGG